MLLTPRAPSTAAEGAAGYWAMKFDSGSGCSISTVETLSITDRTSDTSKSHR
jgi:hypothetical protein